MAVVGKVIRSTAAPAPVQQQGKQQDLSMPSFLDMFPAAQAVPSQVYQQPAQNTVHPMYAPQMQRKQNSRAVHDDDFDRRYSNGYCHNLNSQYAMPQVEAYPYAPSHSSNSFYSGSSRSSASLCQYQTQSFDYCEQSINSNQSHSQSSSQGQSPSWFETSKITVSTPVEQALGAEDLESSTGERGRPLELLTTPSSRSRSAASTNSSEEMEPISRPRSFSQPAHATEE